MGSPSYCEMRQMKCKSLDLHWHLVAHARAHGIKPTARAFQCSVLTVRKWLRRYAAAGLAGLHDHSHAPRRCPHKTAPDVERRVLAQRHRTPRFGAKRLQREFELPASAGAIQRVLRQHGLTRRRRKAYQRKRDLRALKATWPALRRLQMDTKHLYDIPHYWPYIAALGLPEYQFTVRCPRTGATFLAYGSECTALYAELAATRLLGHLRRHGIDTAEIVLQTDLGSEFEGNAMTPREQGFDHVVETTFGATHRRISNPNHNADVESLHNLIEIELFDIEPFRTRADFFGKLATYQAYFNLARPNSYKGWKTPWDILAQAEPQLPMNILLLPPADLDMLANATLQGDHNQPALPGARPKLA
jgi:transposase